MTIENGHGKENKPGGRPNDHEDLENQGGHMKALTAALIWIVFLALIILGRS